MYDVTAHSSMNFLRLLHRYLFFALLAFLPTQLGFHLWPVWTYVLGRRVDYLSPTVYLTDIIIVLLITAWIIDQLFKLRNHEKNFFHDISSATEKNRRKTHLLLIGAAAFVTLNILLSDRWQVATYMWAKVLEYTLLGIYIFATRPSLRTIVWGFSFAGFYSAAIAVIQFVLQRSVGGALWWLGERTFTLVTPGIARLNVCFPLSYACRLMLRSYATFPHPNVLGGFLAISSILMLAPIVYQRHRLSLLHAFWFGAVFVLSDIGLGLTFSRSAWMVSIGGIIAMFYFWRAQRNKKDSENILRFGVPIAAIIVLAILLLYFFPTSSDESVVQREQLTASAFAMWSRSPFFGVGLGNFLVALPEVTTNRSLFFLQPVHSIYLLLLAETGIIGFATFGVFLYLFTARVYRIGIGNWTKFSHSYAPIYTLAFVMLLLIGTVDHYLFTLQQGQILFVLLSVLSSSI